MYDKEIAVKMLGKQVEKMGADYIYPALGERDNCVYFDWDTHQPSCIVGHVLAEEFGMSFEDLDAHGLNSEAAVEDIRPLLTDDDGEPLFTDDALKALAKAQCVQDRGEPWGRALELAATHPVGVLD